MIGPGSRVRFMDADAHERFQRYYPPVGTVGIVLTVNEQRGFAVIRWPNPTTSGNGVWGCLLKRLQEEST